jgi:hypothetical protein
VTHIDPQVLAQFAEGRLRRAEIPALLAHVDGCERCTAALEAANDAVSEEAAPAQANNRWWLLAAAVLAVVAVAVPLMRTMLRRAEPDMPQLVALAPRSARVLEPRLAGDFPYAVWRGPARAETSEVDPAHLRLGGAAADAIDRADRERSPAAQHEAGVALLLIEKPLDAVRRLEDAAARTPKDARIWSDLAAARCAAADRAGKPSLYPSALAAADRALDFDPRLTAALFNRALIVERMGLSEEARYAWQAYLAFDPSSAWAAEARAHLARLQPAQTRFQDDQPRLESAAVAGDAATVAAIVAAHPQLARTYGETWYLGQWGMTRQTRFLTTARAIGDALVTRSGEMLLRDSVHELDRADDTRRAELAAAYARYYKARLAYSQQKPGEAEPELRAAAKQFGASPMALVARYYAANTRYDLGGVSRARAEVAQLLGEAGPGFRALRAQLLWQLALCTMIDTDWDGALPLLTSAADEFRALGERAHAAFVETLLADTLGSLGRVDDEWTARIRAFTALSAENVGDRLPVSIGAAARLALRGGDREAALPLLRLEEAATRRAQRDTLLADALVRLAVLRNELGDGEAASRAVREAESVAGRITDPALQGRAKADVQFATANVLLHSDPRRARELLGQAIDAYRARELPLFLPEAYLVRARAALAVGEKEEAARDLDSGLASLERHRVQFAESVVGTGVLDAGNALAEERIALALDRGDTAGALVYAERARSQALDVAELQRKLAGTRTAVLELVVLPHELVAFCVTANQLNAARTPIERSAVMQRTDRWYELLLQPSEQAFAGARQLLVVADPLLAAVPFGALYEGAALAPSAAVLQRAAAARPRSLLAVALPAGERVALPESEREANEIASLYARTRLLAGEDATLSAFTAAAPGADVVHIAGHTSREPGAGNAALVFASGQRAAWQTIAATHFAKGALVLLSACETLRPPPGRTARAFTLGDGVLAAGAAEVIGTLTPIADVDARQIFRAIHQRIAGGESAANAVREVQHDLPAARRSVALLTTRID